MRYLILFSYLVFSLSAATTAHAASEKNHANAQTTLSVLTDQCLKPAAAGKDIAQEAIAKSFPEFPAEEARKFAPDGARVFGVPSLKGEAVLMVRANGSCSLAIHTIDIAKFRGAMEALYKGPTAFRLIREKRMDDESITRQELRSEASKLDLLITASDAPRPNGIQVLMTAAKSVSKN